MKKIFAMFALLGIGGGNKIEEKSIDFTPKEPPIPKGLKQFEINGKIVYSLNKKNAIRKANKIKCVQ